MSLHVQEQVLLKDKTTLGIGGTVSHFVRVTNEEELRSACLFARERALRIIILGGGSNVLVTDRDIQALVIVPAFESITYSDEDDTHVRANVGAGVVLDSFVDETVTQNLWGVENLSHIPGLIGALPIQNVGAYGVEAKDVVVQVSTFDMRTGTTRIFEAHECAFDYRTSFFKTDGGRHYIITHVTFRLSRVPMPRIGYKDLASRFHEGDTVTQRDIRNAVIQIRSTKFPDWHTIGTAGSFFKNPIISREHFEELRKTYPELPGFSHNDRVKVPLGWILDKILQIRGYRKGNVGLFEAQALVLVNFGEATFDDVRTFSDEIIQKVFDATRIRVEREVVLIE